MRTCAQILALAALSAGLMSAADTPADRAFQDAEKAARAGDRFKALLLYAQASQLDPNNSLYAERRRFLQNSSALAAQTQLGPDPSAPTAQPEVETVTAADLREIESPARLKRAEGTRNFSLKGDARAVLSAERVALNFVQHLSGIATQTARFVEAARPATVLATPFR